MGWVVRLAFARLSALLPVRRVAETGTVIAFEHPAPSWSPHLLFVPKRSIGSFLRLRPDDAPLFGELVRLAFAVAARQELDANGFAVLVNGGAYQDVAQLHLHLAGLDRGLQCAAPASRPELTLLEVDGLVAFEHPRARREVHVAIVPSERLAWRDLDGVAGERLGRSLVGVGQRLVRQLGRESAGFTLLASVPAGGDAEAVCFHLVGGDRREARADALDDGEPGGTAQRSS
jgi:histidine triad (HIT) family protein